MRRFIRFVAISIGVLLALCVAGVVAVTLVTHYRYERSVKSVSNKLVSVMVSTPQVVWDTDLHPYSFPDNAFDSPYLDYAAPATVAMSDSVAAVTFQNSSYAGNRLVEDIRLVTLSFADGSLVRSTKWPRQGPPGLSPVIFCCTKNGEFYAHDNEWLIVKNGEVVGKQKANPVGPSIQQIHVSLGNSDRPTSIEIGHENGSKSTFQTNCDLVHDWFLSKDRFVLIGCNALSVIGLDGQTLFSDSFPDKGLMFGGSSEDGKRFVISVTSYEPGDPPSLTDEWLVIYDTEKHSATFAVKSDRLPYQQSQTALSSDGKYLLVGSGGHLKLLKVQE